MQEYPFESKHSRELTQRLERSMPGGNTRSSVFYKPFPLAIERGDGYKIWDADGNEFIDFLNNYASLVHGHSHPAILKAISDQAARGIIFSSPSAVQAELAERICDRIKTIEKLRFTNSGTEAIMVAVRAARAFTGREHIVMAEGGYHGSWDQVCASSMQSVSGIPESIKELVHFVKYNDSKSLEQIMEAHGKQIAAIVLEPVLGAGGIVTGSHEFFKTARKLADKHQALLVLDEIITARLALRGYQSVIGVKADITALGKIIGGGLPVGALGGRKDIMDLFDPTKPNFISHSGTFNGNLLTMAAGCVSLDLLTEKEITRINSLGAKLQKNLSEVFAEHRLDGTVNGCGSLLQLNLPASLLSKFHLMALKEGIYFAPRGFMNISTAMNENLIDGATQALARAAAQLSQESRISALS